MTEAECVLSGRTSSKRFPEQRRSLITYKFLRKVKSFVQNLESAEVIEQLLLIHRKSVKLSRNRSTFIPKFFEKDMSKFYIGSILDSSYKSNMAKKGVRKKNI